MTLEGSSELAKTAKDLHNRLGDHVSLIIGYGSWVYGTQKPDSMKDFIVVVDDPRQFYNENEWVVQTPYVKPARSVEVQTFLNRLSPNFYHLDGGKIKIGVISKAQFTSETYSFSKYIGFRLTKPLAVFQIPGSGLSQDDSIDVISDLREENLFRVISLLPRNFTFEDFALKYVGVSYEADVRFEDPSKIRSTYEANKSKFDKMFAFFLKDVPTYDGTNYTNNASAIDFYREKVSMALRKPLFLAQNFLNFFTAADPIGYTMRKMRLGTGK